KVLRGIREHRRRGNGAGNGGEGSGSGGASPGVGLGLEMSGRGESGGGGGGSYFPLCRSPPSQERGVGGSTAASESNSPVRKHRIDSIDAGDNASTSTTATDTEA